MRSPSTHPSQGAPPPPFRLAGPVPPPPAWGSGAAERGPGSTGTRCQGGSQARGGQRRGGRCQPALTSSRAGGGGAHQHPPHPTGILGGVPRDTAILDSQLPPPPRNRALPHCTPKTQGGVPIQPQGRSERGAMHPQSPSGHSAWGGAELGGVACSPPGAANGGLSPPHRAAAGLLIMDETKLAAGSRLIPANTAAAAWAEQTGAAESPGGAPAPGGGGGVLHPPCSGYPNTRHHGMPGPAAPWEGVRGWGCRCGAPRPPPSSAHRRGDADAVPFARCRAGAKSGGGSGVAGISAGRGGSGWAAAPPAWGLGG